MRSGYVIIYYAGRLGGASLAGNYWSRDVAKFSSAVGGDAATAYYLRFNASSIYPSDGGANHWYGFHLRCLAL